MGSKEVGIVKTLQPLIIECQVLAIWAPYPKTIYKFYAAVIQILLIFGFTKSVYGKQMPLFDSYASTVKIVDQIANLFLTLTSATTSLLTIFLFPKKLCKLCNDINKFDSIAGKYSTSRKKLFWVSFVVVQLMTALIISLDCWVWIGGVGYEMYKYYIVRDIQYYQINVVIMLIFWMAMEIHCRYRLLNELLIKFTKGICDEEYFSLKHPEKTNISYKDFKYIAKLQNFLFDILNNFNGIFGIILLFTILFFIMYIVQYTVQLIVYTVFDNKLNGASFGTSLLIISVVWIIECLTLLIALAAAGDYIFTEGKRTSAICYRIINNMPMSFKQDLIKEELKLIAQQTSCRNPTLSAFGFFTVNFTMMGFIVTSVTSYIIVAIQFLI